MNTPFQKSSRSKIFFPPHSCSQKRGNLTQFCNILSAVLDSLTLQPIVVSFPHENDHKSLTSEIHFSSQPTTVSSQWDNSIHVLEKVQQPPKVHRVQTVRQHWIFSLSGKTWSGQEGISKNTHWKLLETLVSTLQAEHWKKSANFQASSTTPKSALSQTNLMSGHFHKYFKYSFFFLK